jgi:hypothetical protein
MKPGTGFPGLEHDAFKYRSLSAAITKEDSDLLSLISILGFSITANTWPRPSAIRSAENAGKE